MGDKKYLAINNDGWNVTGESERVVGYGEGAAGGGRLM
jgi:hypothetical protein